MKPLLTTKNSFSSKPAGNRIPHVCNCDSAHYLIAYTLLSITWGFLETFHSSLFIQLEYQLQVDHLVVASIFTVKSIAFAVSSIASGYILDAFHETHAVISLIILFSAICVSLIPFISLVWLMYVLFIFVGFALGAIIVSFPVYIFRKYPQKQQKMMYIFMTIYGISKVLIPVFVQLSIQWLDDYQYALFLIAALCMATCVYLCILSTPIHDPHRNLSSKSQKSESTSTDYDYDDVDIVQQLMAETDARSMCSQRFILFNLTVIMFLFSATQSGLVNFITIYCAEYLLVHESIGRYLISAYYAGQLFYRLLVAMCVGERLKRIWLPTRTIFAAFLFMVILLVLFVLFDEEEMVIFVVYTGCGFFSSSVFPDIFKWCELMTPVNGTISGVFVVAFSAGDAFMVFFIGEIIDKMGVKLLPFPVLTASVVGMLFIVVNTILFARYQRAAN